MGKRAANAQQVAAVSPDHGSPFEVVDMGRQVLGGRIDLDPATSRYWNHYTVRASTIYDQESDGLKQRWRGRTILNPPGTVQEPGKARPTSMPKLFWEKLVESYVCGDVETAFFVGFSIEQLAYLQGSPMHPLQFLTLIPSSRLEFLRRPHHPGCDQVVNEVTKTCLCKRSGTGPPVKGESPMHGNYLTLLPSRQDRDFAAWQVRKFIELSQSPLSVPGALVRPAI